MSEAKYPLLEQVSASEYAEAYNFDRARDATLRVYDIKDVDQTVNMHSLRVIAREVEYRSAVNNDLWPVHSAYFGSAALYLLETGHLRRGDDKLIRKSTSEELEEARRTRAAAKHIRTLIDDNQTI